MHVRPYKAVRQLGNISNRSYAVATKVVSFTSLLGHAYLDQADRPRRKPTRHGAKRVIRTKSARHVRITALAHLQGRAWRHDPEGALYQRLSDRIWSLGGLTTIADSPPSDDLVARVKANQKDVDYAVSIVEYLLRSNAYPEDGIPSTVEDAKGFVWKWFEEYSVSKIARIWEDYKLVAPYLYALHLEKSFRPSKIERVDSIIDWASSFVKSSRRIERFLGHASFVMDVLKGFARDQRESDFVGVSRIAPPLRRFSDEEKLISASIDRMDPDYGRSFQV
ncbi:hypothetical protein [Bradyrhizobium vignae]|uniref:hypothetical protein n=1 Tax=Bradyrhizobium vignae TaxID=1549949 RepID=UPI00100AACC5|nr:hypothetical protein [Bradyrhizobium vignae]RXH02197.1 hypothetical protein EAV90_15980 [Bradyrhizobium vignae]